MLESLRSISPVETAQQILMSCIRGLAFEAIQQCAAALADLHDGSRRSRQSIFLVEPFHELSQCSGRLIRTIPDRMRCCLRLPRKRMRRERTRPPRRRNPSRERSGRCAEAPLQNFRRILYAAQQLNRSSRAKRNNQGIDTLPLKRIKCMQCILGRVYSNPGDNTRMLRRVTPSSPDSSQGVGHGCYL